MNSVVFYTVNCSNSGNKVYLEKNDSINGVQVKDFNYQDLNEAVVKNDYLCLKRDKDTITLFTKHVIRFNCEL
ncbi:MAG: hypothetical protein RR543_02725 [Erysipelotrichales bacterium]